MDAPTAPDYAAIKQKQIAAWSAGDYAVIGITLQIVGEHLAEALDLVPGSAVLDVAAGNGNATLAFARRWHRVTSTDYVEALLDRGRERAAADRLDIDFRVADAENLPFDDNTFDGVVSTFGVMFTPNQEQAAAELTRVCKPGGKIGMANWTPDSFIGALFKTIGKHIPPPPGVQSPARWGTRDWLDATFASADGIETESREFVFRYRDPAHFMDIFRTYYGPVQKALLALGDKAPALEADILALIDEHNTATDSSMSVPAEYLEVVITK